MVRENKLHAAIIKNTSNDLKASDGFQLNQSCTKNSRPNMGFTINPTPPATTPSIFGNTPMQQQPLFGQQLQNNAFGQPTLQLSPPGQPIQQPNLFAQLPQHPNQFGQPLQQPNQFGQPAQQQLNQFGQPAQQQLNQFGQPAQQQLNQFGQQPNQFGQPAQQQLNQFGQPAQQQQIAFGQPVQQQPNQYAQQQQPANPFLQQNLFGQPQGQPVQQFPSPYFPVVFPQSPPTYNEPTTASYSQFRNRVPDLVNTSCLQAKYQAYPETILPPNAYIGQGRPSDKAMDFFSRNSSREFDQSRTDPFSLLHNDRDSGWSINDFRGSTDDSNLGYNYDKNAVAAHLKRALYNTDTKSRQYSDIKATLLREDMERGIFPRNSVPGMYPPILHDMTMREAQRTKSLQNNFLAPRVLPRRRYYSKLPYSDGYYVRRHDIETQPTHLDYIHEFDLIEVNDYPELPNFPYISNKPRKETPLQDFVVMESRPGAAKANNNNSRDHRNSINCFTLKPKLTWKTLSQQSRRRSEEEEDIGKNRRSFSNPGRLFRRMGTSAPNWSFDSENNNRNSLFPVSDSRRTGPPIRNDPPDFTELLSPSALINFPKPSDIVIYKHSSLTSSSSKPIVGNLSKRLTPSDVDKIKLSYMLRKERETSTDNEIDAQSVRSRISVPGVNVSNKISSESLPKTQEAPEEGPFSFPEPRQRKARSKMTTGHGYKFKCGVTLTKDKYYCCPSVEELHKITDNDGNCFVQNFEVGHVEFGHVVFPERFNVAGLNLDTSIIFEQGSITVYPNKDVAPALGDGLRRPASVTLENIWPRDLASGQILKDGDGTDASNFADTLRFCCRQFKGKFIRYNPTIGRWNFEVQDFIR